MAQTMVFQDGGKLRSNALYVVRRADEELYRALLDGEYCSILDPRQVGKSSLMERVSQRLEQAGARCGYIDMQSFASAEITFEKLINGLVFTVARSLKIKIDVLEFLTKYENLPPNKVLEQFFRAVVFRETESQIVLFIDEVDIVKSFNNPTGERQSVSAVGDDFFLTFRSFHESRTRAPFNRLSVCFAGVAFPSDLVSRPELSPFNVGKRISLSDFSIKEMQGFRQGLTHLNINLDELISEVYYWTSGHPYMSQRLFLDLAKYDFKDKSVKVAVQERVNQLFFRPNISPDANLAYAVKRLTSPYESEAAKNRRPQILETFSRIKRAEGKKILIEKNLTDTDTPSYDESRLFGLTSFISQPDGNYLAVRNRIYDNFFSDEWVANAIGEQRDFRPFFEKWIREGKSDDYLLRGAVLAAAVKWASGREDVTVEEREFLDKSQEYDRQQLLIAEQARSAKYFKRAALTTATLLAGAVFALAIATWLFFRASTAEKSATNSAIEANTQRQEAQRQSDIAVEESVKAQASQFEAERQADAANKARQIAETEGKKAEAERKNAEVARDAATKSEQQAKKNFEEAQKQTRIANNAKDRLAQQQKTERENLELKRKAAINLERSAESKFSPEQQSLYLEEAIKSAAAIKTDVAKNPLPQFFDLDEEKVAGTARKEDAESGMEYAGEVVRNKMTENYYYQLIDASGKFINTSQYVYNAYRLLQGSALIFQNKNWDAAKQLNLPLTLNNDSSYSTAFADNGDSVLIDRYGRGVLIDNRAKSFFTIDLGKSLNSEDDFSASASSAAQSKNNPDAIALLVQSLSSPYSGPQHLIIFSKEKHAVETVKSAAYFVNTADDVFIYQDAENNLHSIDIGNGTVQDLSKSPIDVSDAETQRYSVSAYINKKNGDIAILKSGDMKSLIEIFNYKNPQNNFLKFPLDAYVSSLEFSPDGNRILAVTYKNGSNYKLAESALTIFDVSKNAVVSKNPIAKFYFSSYLPHIFFSPDAAMLGVVESYYNDSNEQSNTVHLFDAKAFLSLEGERQAATINHSRVEHRTTITSAVFYPTTGEKKLVVSGDYSGVVKVSETNGQAAMPDKNFSSNIRDIRVSSGDLIIASQRDYLRTALEKNAWLEKDKADIRDFSISGLRNLKVSPTFDKFAVSGDRQVRVWSGKSELLERLEPSFETAVSFIEFSSGEEYLIAATASEAILWKIERDEKTGGKIRKKIWSYAESPDDKKTLGNITAVSFSDAGRRSLVEFEGGYLIYDTEQRKIIARENFRAAGEAKKSNDLSKQFYNPEIPDYWLQNTSSQFNFLPSVSRFSSDGNLFVTASKIDAVDKTIAEIFGENLKGFFASQSTQKYIVRIIDIAQKKTIGEFIIDDLKYAKFSADGGEVALFTEKLQCYIVGTRSEQASEAMLIPLESITVGDFSSDGEKFITTNGKEIYIYNTADALLSYKVDFPAQATTEGGNKITIQNATIDFVRFDGDDGIIIGRRFFYQIDRQIAEQKTAVTNKTNASESNVAVVVSATPDAYSSNTSYTANSKVYIPVQTTTQVKFVNLRQRTVADTSVECYRITDNSILVAKSRCGK